MGFIEGNWGNGVSERSQIPLEEGQQIRICSDQIGFISRAKHIIFTWNLGRMISIMNKSNIQNFIIRFNLEGREMIIWNFNGRKWMYISKFYYIPIHGWISYWYFVEMIYSSSNYMKKFFYLALEIGPIEGNRCNG